MQSSGRLRRFRGIRRWRIAVAVIPALTAGLAVAAPAAPAQASAYGCTRWGSVTIPVPDVGDVKVPVGVYCFGLVGSGQKIDYTQGNYYFLAGSIDPRLYNERERVQFFSNTGAVYDTVWEATHLGWRYGNQSWTTGIHGTARPGRVCGSLVSAGVVIATACEDIS